MSRRSARQTCYPSLYLTFTYHVTDSRATHLRIMDRHLAPPSSNELNHPTTTSLERIFITLTITAVALFIVLDLYTDYKSPTPLGPGGTPSTIPGYLRTKTVSVFAIRNLPSRPDEPARPPELSPCTHQTEAGDGRHRPAPANNATGHTSSLSLTHTRIASPRRRGPGEIGSRHVVLREA